MDDLNLLRDLYDMPPATADVMAAGRARLSEAYTQTSQPDPALLAQPGPDAFAQPGPPERDELRGGRRSLLRALPGARNDRPGARSDRGRRRRWPVVGASLAGAAAAVTVAATLLAPTGQTPSAQEPSAVGPSGRGSSSAVVRLSAREILLAAADSVGPASGEGAYWVRSAVNGRFERDPSDRYTLKTTRSVEAWLPNAADRRTWVIRRDLGTVPATPEDEAAWRAAGSPRSWTLPGANPPVKLRTAPGEPDALRDDTGKTLTLLGTPMTPTTLKALPTTPEGLRDTLEQIISKGYGKERVNMDNQLFETGVRLVMNLPTSPEVRAAAYRMLAALPGATAEGEVTDPLGRRGQAVSRPGGTGEQYRFVVDTTTGQPLALESEIGQDRSYEAIKSTTWTDDEPRLPARRHSMNR
ncbi:CU044_5270 family protein [Nonomuraea spiralis]|uniref:CU044_5270 family protein n=1 Tax=Nonomuraea spiralis TaxID=46182 RepID=UPI0037B629A1